MKIKNKAGKTILKYNADSLFKADLRNADLRGANLRMEFLRNADLRGAKLSGADLEGADLMGADLRWADLDYANLKEADLERANLRYAFLRNSDITGACLTHTELFANSDGAKVHKEYTIIGDNGIMTIGYLGSRYDYTIFFNCQEIIVRCGCYCGTIDEFEKKVKETHGDNKYGMEYRDTIEYVKKIFGRR